MRHFFCVTIILGLILADGESSYEQSSVGVRTAGNVSICFQCEQRLRTRVWDVSMVGRYKHKRSGKRGF